MVVPTPPGARHGKAVADPLAWTPARSADFARRAAAGTSHLLYVRSPGGARAERRSARRAGGRRSRRRRRQAGVDPDRLEALVFLESAGRPDAMAPGGIEGAAGLTQILAETGRDLLGMKVDVARSAPLHAPDPPRAAARAAATRPAAPGARRASVDERFDPAQGARRHRALPGAGQARASAARTSPSSPTTWASGTSRASCSAYEGGAQRPLRPALLRLDPMRHAAAYAKLGSFGDDSSNYLWKLGAAERIMQLAARTRASSRLQARADRRRRPPRRSCTRPARRRASATCSRCRDAPARHRPARARPRRELAAREALAAALVHRRRGARAIRPGARPLARHRTDRARRRAAGRSPSPARTPRAARRSRSSTFSIACRCSTSSPGRATRDAIHVTAASERGGARPLLDRVRRGG